ncbi:sialate O-acetylesterase [Flavobacteriaceae bacterium]|nr:sialate O-acetylesterase [Flavobacteriaceae bacterium]
MKNNILLIISLFAINLIASQNLKLPSIFNDNMILQQDSNISIWGLSKSRSSISITVSWNEKTLITNSDDNGKWIINIKTPKSGKSHEISLKSGDQKISLSNILMGEVWIASGQSNMQMNLKGYNNEPVLGANDAIANSNNSEIRFFTVERNTSETKMENLEGNWSISNPENSPSFSAVAYSFAKHLNTVLDVPVAIIHSSWGGTPAEAWTDSQSLNTDFEKGVIKNHRGRASDEPSSLYNAMINPLINFRIKGAIWYQGESNVARANNYAKLKNSMIEGWRRAWNQGSFPFYFVQISPYKYDGNDKSSSAFLREAQLNTMFNTSNTGMAVSLDVGDENSIHPPRKFILGKRLAYWALNKDYGLSTVEFSGPVFKSLEIKENKVLLKFDYAKSGLYCPDEEINNFELASEDRVFYPANAKIMRNQLEVQSDNVKNPVHVRYGWKNYLNGNLYNTKGLPASSFRSDSWKF